MVSLYLVSYLFLVQSDSSIFSKIWISISRRRRYRCMEIFKFYK